MKTEIAMKARIGSDEQFVSVITQVRHEAHVILEVEIKDDGEVVIKCTKNRYGAEGQLTLAPYGAPRPELRYIPHT